MSNESATLDQTRQPEGSNFHNMLEVYGARMHNLRNIDAVSYTHLRAHETVLDLVCRLLLEKKKKTNNNKLKENKSNKIN